MLKRLPLQRMVRTKRSLSDACICPAGSFLRMSLRSLPGSTAQPSVSMTAFILHTLVMLPSEAVTNSPSSSASRWIPCRISLGVLTAMTLITVNTASVSSFESQLNLICSPSPRPRAAL